MTATLSGISSMATRQLLAALTEAYRRATGDSLTVESIGGVDAARRVRAGEPFDLVVLAEAVMAQLETGGHLLPGSSVGLARSGIAAAVPEGHARPSLADEGAVRQAILDAHTICYSTGPSGDHLKRLWERWDIAAAVAPKAIQAPAGVSVASLLARGEADLGFQQLSELLDVPGVDVLGPLPAAIQATTTFTAAIGSRSDKADAVRSFLRFSVAEDANALKLSYGMEQAG